MYYAALSTVVLKQGNKIRSPGPLTESVYGMFSENFLTELVIFVNMC